MTRSEEWNWMVDYCKEHRLPPAQSWAWKRAKEALREYLRSL